MNFNKEKYLVRGVVAVSITLFALIAYFLFFESGREATNGEGGQSYVLSINGVGFTKEQVERYKSEVARNLLRRGEEDVSEERIFDEAVKRITKEVVSRDFYREKDALLSDEEIEAIIRERVSSYPGVERREDFFRVMEMRGYRKEEIKRGIELINSHERVINNFSQEMEITEDDIKEEYDKYVEMRDGEDILPLEEIYDDFLAAVLYERATQVVLESLERKKEEAEVVFY